MKAFQEFIAKASAELVAESIKHGVTVSVSSSFAGGSLAIFMYTPHEYFFTAEYCREEEWQDALNAAKKSIQGLALEAAKAAA